MTESFVERHRSLIRTAETSVQEALKLQDVRTRNMPIIMDDDGTRFPIAYPDIQVRESTKDGLYRQQVSVFCEGMMALCKISSFNLDSDSLKEFNDVFELYRSRYPYESMMFVQTYIKTFKEVPPQVSLMYDALLRSEDEDVQKNGALRTSKAKKDVLSLGILHDAVNHSLRNLNSST